MFFVVRACQHTEAYGSGGCGNSNIVLRYHIPRVHELGKDIGVLFGYFGRKRPYRDMRAKCFQSRSALGGAQRGIGESYTY
jgi:hypothetical protein